jgi:hypothetical protein
VSLLSKIAARCEFAHLRTRRGGEAYEPVDVALLEELEPDCTLVDPVVPLVELVEVLELPVLVVAELLLAVAVPFVVAMTAPSVPALAMPTAASTAVRRRAPRRPVSRRFMGFPFVELVLSLRRAAWPSLGASSEPAMSPEPVLTGA